MSRLASTTDLSLEFLQPKQGILVLSGFGLRVAVDRGHLVVSDGIGETRRSGRLSRATADLQRLVVLGHSGTISLDALRWLYDVGAAFVQLDADGTVIVASGPSGLDDARLRRAQARAADTEAGIAIARDLLLGKLDGQAELLTRLPGSDEAIVTIAQARTDLEQADTPNRLRGMEAKAAAAYWSAWSPVTVRFAKRDQPKIPAHWQTFGSRASAVTGTPRSATNPANALLNFCYAILETEVRLAVLTMGLDPGLGFLHADLRSRDSLVYDVLEPVRPVVDGQVLTLLEERTFAAREFYEGRNGVVRLMPPLPQALAEMSPRLARLAAPVVEQVAQRLAQAQGTTAQPLKVPTLLTQANRSAGRDTVRTSAKRVPAPEKLEAPLACRMCGVLLTKRRPQYCDDCRPEVQAAQVGGFSAAGRDRMAELRAAGQDPSRGGEAAKKRAVALERRMREEAVWEAAHGAETFDEGVFRTEILPGLQAVSLGTMAKSTGLSAQYCGLIRRGLLVPHPRHWETFGRLAEPTRRNDVH
jgi:CRISPR-associated endonuclease Cas1